MHEAIEDHDQSRVLDFWFRELEPADWFRGGEDLDRIMHDRFAALLDRATAGDLDGWAKTPQGRLALILILDQFARNIRRDTAGAFACDPRAQALTLEGIALGMDERLPFAQRHFFYMPLMHAEDSQLQAQSLECFARLRDYADYLLTFAREHADEITRFSRFPGRNAALARSGTAEEAQFLQDKANR